MTYLWTDTQAIVQDLCELYPDMDPQLIRFTELHRMICALPNFKDEPSRSNEKILEAVQMAWIDEVAE
jgi:FeS assembly protein IscX